MTKVYLNRKINQRIALGHPWIYNNEVDRIAGPVEQGDIVEVYYFDGQLAGRGYINPESQIIIRLLTRKREDITAAFFHQKFRPHGITENIWAIRKTADWFLAKQTDCLHSSLINSTTTL